MNQLCGDCLISKNIDYNFAFFLAFKTSNVTLDLKPTIKIFQYY